VDKGQEPLRIDKFLQARITHATRSKVQRAIEFGHVMVNGKAIKSNYKIRPGDIIIVYSETTPETFEIVPEKMELDIRYEDDDVLVINKPVGLVVHPGAGNYTGTLVNGVACIYNNKDRTLVKACIAKVSDWCIALTRIPADFFCLPKRIKQPLTLPTSFLIIPVERKYIALVWGNFEEEQGTISGHVGRHQRLRKIMDVYPDGEHGKEAVTHYTVIESSAMLHWWNAGWKLAEPTR
jgi:23S rRNA pseudouridine1911/1915/1917 synthase